MTRRSRGRCGGRRRLPFGEGLVSRWWKVRLGSYKLELGILDLGTEANNLAASLVALLVVKMSFIEMT